MLLKECTTIFNGSTPNTSDPSFWDGGIIWITPKDLSTYTKRYIEKGERNISQAGYDSCSTKMLPKNTVVLTSRAPIGYLAIAKCELCTNQGFKSLVCKNSIIPLYLYYWLSTKIEYLKSISGGATFKELSKDTLENIIIKLPDLSTQQHIVDTIGSVDDLIEKNEEIIGKLYEYINHKYIYYTINKELINIGDLVYIEIAKSGIEKFNDKKIYIDTSAVSQCNITDNTYIITYDDRPSRANMQPKANTVWFAKLKESPKYIIVKNSSTRIINNCIFSTGFMGLQSDANIINYLYALVLSKSFNDQKDSSSTGATMMGINNDIFNSIKVPNVSKDEATYFGQSIENYIQLIINLKEKNYILKQIKQTLLSKYFD